MSAVRAVGLTLAVVGAAIAILSAGFGAFSASVGGGGSAGTASGSGTVGVQYSAGNLPWVGIGVCALGVVLVIVGRK
jgi:hypothetical protein